MAKAQWIARQSSHPRGWIGTLVARVMAWDTRSVNERALGRIDPRPDETILDLGCGHGRTLARLAAALPEGFAAGVDPSEVMLREARRRNRRAIRAGRVAVEHGEADALPCSDDRFDAVLSVHTIYFWPDLEAGLREVRRVLRPGGRLLLVHRPQDDATAAALPANIYRLRSLVDVEKQLAESGFEDVRSDVDGASSALVSFTFATATATGAAA